MSNIIQDAINFLHPQQIISPLPPDQTLNTPQNMNMAQDVQSYMQNVYPQILKGLQSAPQTTTKDIKQAVGQLNSMKQAQAQQTPNPTPTPVPWDSKHALSGYVMSTPSQYVPIIKQAAQQYNVPTNILSGVLARESMRFNPNVISGKYNSPAGAQGIAQFMPTTAQGMGINPLDPNQAIPAAAKLLASHYKQFGNDPAKALAAYNAGPGAVAQYNGVPPFQETQNYISGIMNDAKTVFTGN